MFPQKEFIILYLCIYAIFILTLYLNFEEIKKYFIIIVLKRT